MIKRLCIIGVGLIGGSLARGLKRVDACEHIVGCGRDLATLERAQSLGVIDSYSTDVSDAVARADLIVLSVPLGAMEPVIRQLVGNVDADAVITDVGSAKGSVLAVASKAFGQMPANFVPGHPIAGTEKSGVDASFAELYQGRRVILTPVEQTSALAIEKVRWMWDQVGADVVNMAVDHHDEVLAATSHLPHMLAYTLVDTLARMDESEEIFQYAAGGFRDFTRIASSDPVMWRDISIANRASLLRVINLFRKDLDILADIIEKNDGKALREIFTRAKKARDRFSAQVRGPLPEE